ncbi:MAG: choice-of-anchor V domain-containing protein [Salibacteraceae bacterium]
MEKILLRFTLSACIISGAFMLNSYSGGGFSADHTGSPLSSGTCAQGGCHSSFTLNSGPGSVSMTIPSTYYPGTQYSVSLNISQSTSEYGFMAGVLRDNNAAGGTFSASTGSSVTTINSRSYIKHSGPSTSGSWTFNWTAPSFADTITFYYAGNAANANNNSFGDYIYTGSNVIYPLPLITFDLDSTVISCFGACDGGLSVSNISGGAGGPFDIDWSTSSTVNSITNLCAGTYTLTITDDDGNEEVTTINLSQPDEIISNINAISSTCATGDGEVSVTPNGGAGGFSFLWNTGSMDSIIQNASIGEYIVTITDQDGCSIVDTANVDEAGSGLVGSFTSTPENCGQSNGSTELTMAIGNPPYSYAWNVGGSGNIQTNLTAGIYIVTVTDNLGCQEVFSDTVGSTFASIDENTSSSSDLVCAGIPSGEATAVAGEGIPPFSFEWSNGETTASINSLLEGSYTVTLTDNVGCTDELTFVISSPDSVEASYSVLPENDGFCDGSATITASGGTGTIDYTWSHNAGLNSNTAIDLCAGQYTVTVSDANACNVVLSIEIPSVTGIETTSNDGFSIFPNPAGNSVFLKGDLMNINAVKLIDISGRTVRVFKDLSSREMDLSGLASGRYTMLIETDQNVHYNPFMINK